MPRSLPSGARSISLIPSDLLGAGFSYDALGVAEAALVHASESEMRQTVLALQSEAMYSGGEDARLLSNPSAPESVGQG